MNSQKSTIQNIDRILDIFESSDGQLRPHFVLTGPSGSGKTHTIETLAEKHDIAFLEINAAQLTKEGLSGNSLSKCLSPLLNKGNELVVCLVDEFDKLFIAGNSNGELAHESTQGVQNEFLKVLESSHASVFGDYGKYVNARVDNVLFIFAGAFNNEEDICIDRLRELGIKTEFLGRVGLIYNLKPVTLAELKLILSESATLHKYLDLFPKISKKDVLKTLNEHLDEHYPKNPIGVRYLNNIVHQYFINGGKLNEKQAKQISFNKTLSFDDCEGF